MFENPGEDRAVGLVRPGQITHTHQKFADNLPAGETERSAEKLRPRLKRARVVRGKPKGERAVRLPQRLEASGIFGGGFDLEPVADDPRIGEQAVEIARAEGGDAIDREIREGGPERRAFLEDCRPGEARLIDFEHQSLEQHALLLRRKAVLGVMVHPVDRIPGCEPAISRAHLRVREG